MESLPNDIKIQILNFVPRRVHPCSLLIKDITFGRDTRALYCDSDDDDDALILCIKINKARQLLYRNHFNNMRKPLVIKMNGVLMNIDDFSSEDEDSNSESD